MSLRVALAQDEVTAMKPKFPAGQVPALEIDGTMVPQVLPACVTVMTWTLTLTLRRTVALLRAVN